MKAKAKRGKATAKRIAPDEATRIARTELRKSAFAELLGFVPEKVTKGRAILRMDVRDHHRQIHNVVHGGVLAAFVDTAAAVAAYSTIPRDVALATVELKINFLRAVPGGRIKADARVLRAGRNFVVSECEVWNADGSMAAKALLTFGAASGHRISES